jgi:hypothetical protein
MISSYEYWQEYYRVRATLYVDESGIYKELPEEITSGYITVDVVYRICMVDLAGRIRIQDFANPSAMNKDKEVGGDIYIDGTIWYGEEGPAATDLICQTVYSPYLPSNLAYLAEYMHSLAKNNDAFLP